MKKLSREERIWAAGVVVLLLCLAVKSYGLDAWKPHEPREIPWAEIARQALLDEQDTWLLRQGILTDRIVAVKEIRAEKAGDAPMLKITVRSYVGGFLPAGDRKLTVPVQSEH